MDGSRLKSWQWTAIGLVVGLLVWTVQRFAAEHVVPDFGETINGHLDFEQALVRDVKIADGSTLRAFDNLRVYLVRLEGDGRGTREAHVVAGTFLSSGRFNSATGQNESQLQRRCYVADIPNRPRGKGATQYASVMQYLDTLGGRGVSYRYAWWKDPAWGPLAWGGGCFVVIGVAWPLALNLWLYGSLWRPVEEKPQPAPVFATEAAAEPKADLTAVVEYNARVESELVAVAGSADASSPSDVSQGEQAASLSQAPLEPQPEPGSRESREFGAREDDFYPTERRASHGTRQT